MNKTVYLGLSILEIRKIVTYEFWYDYLKPKYGEKVKFWYMDTYSYIVYIKADDVYKDIGKDVGTRLKASNYEVNRPLPKGKNKKVVSVMKNELGGKMMK